ncbi:MarR family transcriptional regulator [Escherichia coli]|uniref:MarR family transcriptional regulator n=1 Tax=Escherichia coli TaxID=562 RepID=UPI00207B55E1|nr:MarR family transcriptional regulator [Escherichia coli]
MNNIDLLKTITNYKKIKNPAYPAQESLLIHLYIRVNDKIQSIIENELSEYRINTSTFMVLVSLYMSDDYCQSPSDIYKELHVSKSNITQILDKLEQKNIAKINKNKNESNRKSNCFNTKEMKIG